MGVEGLEAEAGSRLRRWDPNHYGSLHIPGDGFSYDIFAQVSRALVSSRWRTGADPLAGLSVKHCIGTGQSQFAARLATYVSAMHPVTNFFSGFMFCVLVGGGSELSNPEIWRLLSRLAYQRTRAEASMPSPPSG
jgi:Alpha/beta hydrolase domain